ncbi:MAG: GNAT family N-acetyltransferase [Chloroflexota bacterium]
MARFRQAVIDDIEAAADVRLRTLDESRRGAQRLSPSQRWGSEKTWWEHLIRSSRGGFWVAEDGSTIIGIVCAIVRDGEWLLTHHYVLPEKQGHGVGRGLLERALRSARGTDRHAAYADASSFSSTSLYMRHGMFPARDIVGLTGPVNALERVRASADGLLAEPLGAHSTTVIGHIDALDRQVRGTGRNEDHRFWIDLGMRGLLFRRHGQIVGYAYCSPWGGIGPVAAQHETDLPAILERCGQVLAESGVTETSVLVPGVNQTALSQLLLHGFRQTSLGIYVATRPAGDWSHYLLFHSALP